MITQETKPVKTWEWFNLTILKVNLNLLSWKNRNSYNKTYKLPRSTSYYYPLVELTETTTCKLWIHGLLLSWILHKIQAHRLCIFKVQWQQLEWSSRCRKFFSLKTLSLCEGKLLKDLTKDSHKPQYEQHKNVARVSLIYLG